MRNTARTGRTGPTGYSVRCLVRDAAKLAERPWADLVETEEVDVVQDESLEVALRGVQVAYYLVHSMGSVAGFADADRTGARNFARAAAAASLRAANSAASCC